MSAYVDNRAFIEVLKTCVESSREDLAKQLPTLRKAIQATPSAILRNTTIDTRSMQWISQVCSDLTRKSNESAALMLILAQFVKQCRIDSNDLHFVVTALQIHLHHFATSIITDTNEFMSIVMIIHQIEDILSHLGVNRMENLRGLRESLSDAVLLLSHLRIGSLQFNNPHSDQFDIDIAKIFAMIVEITGSMEGANEVLQQIAVPLQTATDRLLDVIECSKVAHEGYLGAFQHAISLLSMCESSTVSLLSKYDRCVSLLTSVSLDNVLDAKRVEIVVGYLSCFFDSVRDDTTNEGKVDIAYHALQQHDKECSFIDRLVDAFISLQSRMKEQMQTLVKEKKKSTKDFKVIFSEIRKGCISCMENVLLQDHIWLQDKLHKKKFWDLCIKSLSTPVLFATAYNTSLRSSAIMTKQMIDYLIQASEMLTNYSVASAEDIVETIRQLIQFKCTELISHPKLLPLLIYSLEHFPKGLNNDDLEGQWKWKTSIVTCLHEYYQQLLQLQINTSSLSETFMTSTTALMKILFLENIQEHIKANSKFAASSSSSGSKRKQASMMEKMDESVELFHSALSGLTAIIEYLFFIQSFPTSIAYDEMVLCCIEEVIKPIMLEDDYMDVMMSAELLARMAAVYQSVSQCSLAHSHVIATIAAICVAGCDLNDNLADRVRVALQSYSHETASTTSLQTQLSNILANSKSTSTEGDSLNTSCLAALGSLFDKLPLSDSNLLEVLKHGQEANVHRLQVLRQILQAWK